MVFEGLTLYKGIILNTKTQIILSISFVFLRHKKIKDFQSRNCKILRSNLCLKKTGNIKCD